MAFNHLSQEQLDDVFQSAVDAGLTDAPTLSQLSSGISPGFRGSLPAAGAPNVILLGTLHKLNQTEKLVGGEVPFSIWLGNATKLAAGTQQEVAFRKAFDRVVASSSGEPEIEGADDLPELEDEVLERLVHFNDMVPFGFLRRGHQAGLAVARMEVPRYQDGKLEPINGGEPNITGGTGWLATSDLVFTNQHVVKARPDKEQPSPADLKIQAENTKVWFDFESEGNAGTPVHASELVISDIKLDFAVLRLAEPPGDPPGGHWKRRPLALTREPLLLKADSGKRIPVNIIQHPLGKAKQLACRNNRASAGDKSTLRYFTDTRLGSSGSPVCNDDWDVVALHRAATRVKGVSFQGTPVPWVNVGTQISAILDHIKEKGPELLQELSAAQQAIGAPDWLGAD